MAEGDQAGQTACRVEEEEGVGAEAGGLSERVTSDTGDSDTDRVQQDQTRGWKVASA